MQTVFTTQETQSFTMSLTIPVAIDRRNGGRLVRPHELSQQILEGTFKGNARTDFFCRQCRGALTFKYMALTPHFAHRADSKKKKCFMILPHPRLRAASWRSGLLYIAVRGFALAHKF